MQFCTLHLSLQVGLSTPNTFSTSTQQRNGYRTIAKKPISGVVGPLVTPSYLSTGSSPFTEAGIHPCFFSRPRAVSSSRHRNEYARWKDCSPVKSCALLCILNDHWSLCKNNFSEERANPLAGLHAIKRNPTTATKSPVFSRQSYFS